MGYDFHITRRENWLDEGDDITREEFIRYVRDDAEFKHPGKMGEDWADWRSPKSQYESWLSWSDGQIYTKNPEPEFINKMVAVARALGARVQGDDGEIYLSATEVQDEGPKSAPTAPATKPSGGFSQWPLWKRCLAAFLFGCVLLGLKLLIFGG